MRFVVPAMLFAVGCSPPPPTVETPPIATAETATAVRAKEPPPAPAPIDAPEISRSVGKDGSVVVLWPRIIPKSDDAAVRELAKQVQDRLEAVAREAHPGVPIDRRPEPERVCPRSGCGGIAVGAVLSHKDSACAVVALTSAPGQSPQQLTAWSGKVSFKMDQVPFREYPESQIAVHDFQRCDNLATDMDANRGAVVEVVRAVK